jgi:hypothetical protein
MYRREFQGVPDTLPLFPPNNRDLRRTLHRAEAEGGGCLGHEMTGALAIPAYLLTLTVNRNFSQRRKAAKGMRLY